MFNDRRSKKLVIVSHCLLNQNAKIDRCAHHPGMVASIVLPLLQSGIGVIQLPCPELCVLGLDRQADAASTAGIEEEDTRVARLMKNRPAGDYCVLAAGEIACQVLEYQKHGFEVLGVLGVNGSPTCGVESNWEEGRENDKPGVFMDALMKEFKQRNIQLLFRGVKVYRAETIDAALRDLINPA